MKKNNVTHMTRLTIMFSVLCIGITAMGQSNKDTSLINDCEAGKKEFIHSDTLMKSLFESAYGYAILPNIGKGGIGVGGAAGNGIVYEKGKMIGRAKMKQVSIGFQFGGQAYREIIFFEAKEMLDRFKKNKVELSAQASAVAAKAGASANAKIRRWSYDFYATKRRINV